MFFSALCFFQVIANAVRLCSDVSIQGGFKSLNYFISILIVRDIFAFLTDSSAQSFAGGPYVFLKRLAKFPGDNPATSYRLYCSDQSLFQLVDGLCGSIEIIPHICNDNTSIFDEFLGGLVRYPEPAIKTF